MMNLKKENKKRRKIILTIELKKKICLIMYIMKLLKSQRVKWLFLLVKNSKGIGSILVFKIKVKEKAPPIAYHAGQLQKATNHIIKY